MELVAGYFGNYMPSYISSGRITVLADDITITRVILNKNRTSFINILGMFRMYLDITESSLHLSSRYISGLWNSIMMLTMFKVKYGNLC